MEILSTDRIKNQVADSPIIYQRGVRLYENGAYCCTEFDPKNGFFRYDVDGDYGDYAIKIRLDKKDIKTSCDCPFPNKGCKHTVGTLLDLKDKLVRWTSIQKAPPLTLLKSSRVDDDITDSQPADPFLSENEIRDQALSDRIKRAGNEEFILTQGDMFKGEHLVETKKGREYVVTLHDPKKGSGHCTCPDFLTNRLGTCKHLIFLQAALKKERAFEKRLKKERFPFIDIYWDSVRNSPSLFNERPEKEIQDIKSILTTYFDSDGNFSGQHRSAKDTLHSA